MRRVTLRDLRRPVQSVQLCTRELAEGLVKSWKRGPPWSKAPAPKVRWSECGEYSCTVDVYGGAVDRTAVRPKTVTPFTVAHTPHIIMRIEADLRALIEAIEAWPTQVEQAQRSAAQRRRPLARPVEDDGADADGGSSDGSPSIEQDPLDDDEHASKAAPAPALQLTSSLKHNPVAARLSSMASAVPRYQVPWAPAANAALGPGIYDHKTVEAVRTHDPVRRSRPFANAAPARPGFPPREGVADAQYAHSSWPEPAAHGLGEGRAARASAPSFVSLRDRFDEAEYLRTVRLLKLQTPKRHATAAGGSTPSWRAYGAPSEPLLPPPPDHAERLAAARASAQRQ